MDARAAEFGCEVAHYQDGMVAEPMISVKKLAGLTPFQRPATPDSEPRSGCYLKRRPVVAKWAGMRKL
jgi:hypothetical protein